MAYTAWYKGLVFQPPVIFGRRLKPFSLAHSMTLEELRNPYVMTLNPDPCAGALHLALWICTLSGAEIGRKLYGGRFPAFRLALRGWWYRNADLRDAHEAFVAYLKDCADRPERAVPCDLGGKEKKRTYIKAPWQYHMVRTLCKVYGMDYERAWDCPVMLASCLHAADMEAEGDDSLIDRNEEATIDRLRAEGKLS